MSQRITPLTRNQLLELEALMHNLLSSVTQHHAQPPTTPGSPSEQSWPINAPSSPTSLSFSKRGGGGGGGVDVSKCSNLPSGSPASDGGLSSSVPAGCGTLHGEKASLWPKVASPGQDDDPSSYFADGSVHHSPCCLNGPQHGSAATALTDHPVLHGTFIDVFTDPWTAVTWRLYDKIEYIVWWSYRPPSCTQCGMQDAWMPSGDVEFQCAFCLTGAGTTRSNAVVEEVSSAKQDQSGMEDSGDDDDDDAGGLAGVGGRARLGKQSGSGSEGGGGPIDAYIFFYEWLQRIPVVKPAGSTSMDSAACTSKRPDGAAGRAIHHPPTSSLTTGTCPHAGVPLSSTGRSGRAERHGGVATSSAASTTEMSGTITNSSSVLLPSGESLPMVLRAAYDMSTLLITPGLPRGTAPALRAAALYLSLLLHRFVSLFPLFCLAGRSSTSATIAEATAAGDNHRYGVHEAVTTTELHHTDLELQWVDVELISVLLGVASPSFFESTEVSLQHLQNVFTVAAAYRVPSVLWHPGRVPGRVETMKALKDKMVPLCPLPFTASGVSGLCPEHTAMIVALELARRVDAQPIAVSSTSPAAAAQNAQRIGLWLDALGLYPTRRAYRDAHSYHQCVMAAEARQDSSGSTTNADAAERHHRILASWEKTLTELAGTKDEELLAAAERHASRHDEGVDTTNPMLLTTPTSPFYKRFEWILTSPCANALLHVFAVVFRVTPMELADMALRSGIYQGSTSGFITTLRTAMLRGAYDVMPLARRLSPLTSSWMCTYMALHSGDRLPLLTALRQLNDVRNTTGDRQAALTRLLQRVLRKHHASQLYQLNFVLRVTDEVEKHFNGVYFLSSVLWREGLATFTCLRSGRKTITLNRYTNRLSLCYMNSKEKLVDQLGMHMLSPVLAAVETEATRLVMETALCINTASVRGAWGHVVRCFEKCARVRRRMRVPMLASRLDALASIRENSSTVARQLHHMPCFLSSVSGQLVRMGPTLVGWRDTETLLAAAPPLDAQQLRCHLQWNYLSLPHVSLLAGLPENRVVSLYASLVGLLELIHLRLSESATVASANGFAGAPSNWVEELLYVEPEEQPMPAEPGAPYQDTGRAADSGWMPPLYRNSRPGTPQQSLSPKSKFGAVSASTNAAVAAAASPSTVASFQGCSASGGGRRHNNGRPPGGSPPLAWQPYTLTPPSVAPLCSPTVRPIASTSTFVFAHNAASTPPTHRVRTPTLTGTPSSRRGGGEVGSLTTAAVQQQPSRNNKKNTGGGGCRPRDACAASAPPLPDLKLAESTADVAKHNSNLSSGARSQRQSRKGPWRRRSGQGEDDNGVCSDGEVGNDDTDEEDLDLRKSRDKEFDDQQQERPRQKGSTEVNEERQRCDDVMRLLRQAVPPYWDVLLGTATDLAVSFLSSSSADNAGGEDEDEDEDESVAQSDRRGKGASSQKRCSQRTGPATALQPTRRGKSGLANTAKGPGAAESTSEALVTHKQFNLFDADECRRRLRRLYHFINIYERRRIVLLQLAAEGKQLPRVSPLAGAAPPPKTRHVSPLIPTHAGATVAGADVSTAVRLSPSLRPSLFDSDIGSNAMQRSPPQRHQLASPHQSCKLKLSPSISPVRSLQSTCRSPRPQQQHRSPPEGLSARLQSGQKGAPSLIANGNPSKQRASKYTSGDVRGSGGAGLDALTATTDDDMKDTFALPPSEVSWRGSVAKPSNSLQELGPLSGRTSAFRVERVADGGEHAPGVSSPLRHKSEKISTVGEKVKRESSATSDSEFEGAHNSNGHRGGPPSSASSEDEQQLDVTHMSVVSRRKRLRDSSDHESEDDDGDMNEGRRCAGDNDRENTNELSRAEQLHRRKAKKTGRRRRRQEQSVRQNVQRKQESSLSPPCSYEPGNNANRSPDTDTGTGKGWRGSDETTPLRNGSPEAPPRSSRIEVERVMDGSLATPPATVPSI
ncbi:hypothetical protein JKF63_06721 [Porcisia hertigi]|uniref:Uncharacterized protein n=1 Tax=Porcisia hertigi TaxID=2761500 RepID=A0A836IWX1_9TRYP|nr:hypothetical protein JKF63_06721 [Porcisia hertigi]